MIQNDPEGSRMFQKVLEKSTMIEGEIHSYSCLQLLFILSILSVIFKIKPEILEILQSSPSRK